MSEPLNDREFVEWCAERHGLLVQEWDRFRHIAMPQSAHTFTLPRWLLVDLARRNLDLADANKRIADQSDRIEEMEDVDSILKDALAGDGFTYHGIASKAMALAFQRDDIKRERDEARETLGKVREAAKLLCDRLGEIEKPINDVICLQFARTGRGYEGPNWGEPLKALLALLPAPPAQPQGKP